VKNRHPVGIKKGNPFFVLDMHEEILNEVRGLKSVLSRLISSGETAGEIKFSLSALDKVQEEFRALSIERDEWVRDSEIKRYIKSAPWHAGVLLRKEFAFTGWFCRGKEYWYSKKDLIAFNSELVKRNIDLKRYAEFRKDKAAFDKKMIARHRLAKSKSIPFIIPVGLKNITTSPVPLPSNELVLEDLKGLKSQFESEGLGDYIDIYQGNHAMLRDLDSLKRYLDPFLKIRCREWCDDFNKAHKTLELMAGSLQKMQVPRTINP
jgi:hypothetical protein